MRKNIVEKSEKACQKIKPRASFADTKLSPVRKKFSSALHVEIIAFWYSKVYKELRTKPYSFNFYLVFIPAPVSFELA